MSAPTGHRSPSADVVALDVSFRRLDGGGKRVQAFLAALDALGLEPEPIRVGPSGIAGTEQVVTSRLHRIKRHLLPVQLRRPVEAQLRRFGHPRPVVSLTPGANRWALKAPAAWLDFPDLWSNFARNHAQVVGAVAGASSVAQAQLWSQREAYEYAHADVVTTASLADKHQLGRRAVWLPTPVTESDAILKQRRATTPKSTVVYGMLANFDYPPNRDAYDRLIRQWLPTLRPSADRIVVAGFGSEKLPNADGTTVIGALADVAEFYEQVDVVLAPIYLGGGMKVKVVEAMMYGRPVIASEHARSGLPEAVAGACVKWEQLQGGSVRQYVDPRSDPRVADDLSRFTLDSFTSIFSSLWRERMVGR